MSNLNSFLVLKKFNSLFIQKFQLNKDLEKKALNYNEKIKFFLKCPWNFFFKFVDI